MGQEFGAKVAGGDTLGKEIYLYGGFGAKGGGRIAVAHRLGHQGGVAENAPQRVPGVNASRAVNSITHAFGRFCKPAGGMESFALGMPYRD